MDFIRDIDEKYALIIDEFSLVSFLVDRYYHTGLPLLWCLPSTTCHLTNTSQPTNNILFIAFNISGLTSSSPGAFPVFNDLITAFASALVI